MSVDNSELMAFQNQIQALKDDIPEIMDSLAVGEGRYARDQARKICKEENIVNTGDYRRNFKSGTKAIRAGNSYKIDVFNNLDYAKPLEYGFRSHFVPGHWEGNSFKYQRNDPDGGMYVGPAGGYWYWWLRTPLASYAHFARRVGADGSLGNLDAYLGYRGVRPALYLESGNLVSDSTDTDGAYILQWNQPPSDPSSISYGTPQAGNSLVLSTGGSTDPEGDAISYVWERKIDSGAYVQLGITTAKTFTDTVPTSGTTYTARVKAVDANGLESGYCTGSAKTISYNTPPVISGSDQNLGAKTAPFTYQYTVTDAQTATQTITVTEKLTNGTQTIALRTYTATSGAQNTVDLSSVWLPLLSGTHVLTITATDSAGGSATRKITFSRTVSRIAAARAFNTDALVQKVFVSLYPATIPADATLHLEVTNNPFDTSPVWVDITDKANRLVHVFTNTTAAKGYGLGYRFYITKGTQEIEITQATIRFA